MLAVLVAALRCCTSLLRDSDIHDRPELLTSHRSTSCSTMSAASAAQIHPPQDIRGHGQRNQDAGAREPTNLGTQCVIPDDSNQCADDDRDATNHPIPGAIAPVTRAEEHMFRMASSPPDGVVRAARFKFARRPSAGVRHRSPGRHAPPPSPARTLADRSELQLPVQLQGRHGGPALLRPIVDPCERSWWQPV